MQNALATPGWPVLKKIKRHLPLKRPFLTLSRPVHANFSIWTLTLWRIFWNWLGLGQSTPIFFSASNTWTFLTALHTRTSTSEQHCSSSIRKVFLNIPDSKIPWDGITVGYFRLFSTTYQIIRQNSVEWYYRRMTFRFPLAEHWSSYYCEIIFVYNKHWLLLQSNLSTSISKIWCDSSLTSED